MNPKYLSIVLGLMLILMGSVSAINTTPIESKSRGNTLYVGGSGIGNYTRIQDAIDDSKNGDTIYVFDDRAPYYENIIIDKSINLIGEDKETTIIDGGGSGTVVHISSDWVNISGFSTINGEFGMSTSFNNTVNGNIISNNDIGIYIGRISHNNITGNHIISNNKDGIYLHYSSNNTISGNNITSNDYHGVYFHNCSYTMMPGNEVNLNNEGGIYLDSSNYNNITNNNIQDNYKFGLFLSSANYNTIESNNIIGNKRQATFRISWGNTWDENYWNNWIGLKINFSLFQRFPKVIVGSTIPWLNVDWHPAQEPYEIGGIV